MLHIELPIITKYCVYLNNYPRWLRSVKNIEIVKICERIDDKYSVALIKVDGESLYGRVRNDEISKYLPKMNTIGIVEFYA